MFAHSNFSLHGVRSREGEKIADGSSPVCVVRDRRSGGVSEGVQVRRRGCVLRPDAGGGRAVRVQGDDEVDEVVGQQAGVDVREVVLEVNTLIDDRFRKWKNTY